VNLESLEFLEKMESLAKKVALEALEWLVHPVFLEQGAHLV
jgi:hypothetical protein